MPLAVIAWKTKLVVVFVKKIITTAAVAAADGEHESFARRIATSCVEKPSRCRCESEH
jgi:hypothetical protein